MIVIVFLKKTNFKQNLRLVIELDSHFSAPFTLITNMDGNTIKSQKPFFWVRTLRGLLIDQKQELTIKLIVTLSNNPNIKYMSTKNLWEIKDEAKSFSIKLIPNTSTRGDTPDSITLEFTKSTETVKRDPVPTRIPKNAKIINERMSNSNNLTYMGVPGIDMKIGSLVIIKPSQFILGYLVIWPTIMKEALADFLFKNDFPILPKLLSKTDEAFNTALMLQSPPLDSHSLSDFFAPSAIIRALKITLTEVMMKKLLLSLLIGVSQVHDAGLVFENLNPETIIINAVELALLQDQDEKTREKNFKPYFIQVSDITSLREIAGPGVFYSQSPSPANYKAFIAPEQDRRDNRDMFVDTRLPALDVYSLGVISYALFTGVFPKNQRLDIEKDFKDEKWNNNKVFRDIIMSMLAPENVRPHLSDIIRNEYWHIDGFTDRIILPAEQFNKVYVSNQQQDMARILMQHIPVTKIYELRELFMRIDADKNGYLKSDELYAFLQNVFPNKDINFYNFMSNINSDGGTDVTLSEFIRYFLYQNSNTDALTAAYSELFKLMDMDKNGRLTVGEIQNFFNDRKSIVFDKIYFLLSKILEVKKAKNQPLYLVDEDIKGILTVNAKLMDFPTENTIFVIPPERNRMQ